MRKFFWNTQKKKHKKHTRNAQETHKSTEDGRAVRRQSLQQRIRQHRVRRIDSTELKHVRDQAKPVSTPKLKI